MEVQPELNRLAASFPAPPPFWKEFTEENLDRISKLRVSQTFDNLKNFNPATTLPLKLLEPPPELRYLQPPDPPAKGQYRCFGDQYDLNIPLPSLDEQGITSLYTPPSTPGSDGKHGDRAFILKRLAKSLLLNFLELVGILSVNPDQAPEKIQDLRTLFINFHHLLNEYRPHQARESLILMMQDQLEKSRAETKGIMDMKGKVESILEGLNQKQSIESDKTREEDTDAPVIDDGSDVWDELEKEFG
ncbi:MED7 protein-domain-containing protein [Amylocarpus encephaloides]|uniref:Mediator of RNA polymerase II transcription subunit 7 n=1 Tax=Amylocarpus encephaloides TaxID=45428 RepID=A0A9P8C9S3_9HELO|nr:MED7 protein-domain-containing protein [Amylocarpus encephaloides]